MEIYALKISNYSYQGEKISYKFLKFLIKSYEKGHEFELDFGCYGKPFLVNSSLEFNISHSAQWVVCAINNNSIGIDIEKIKKINYEGISKRFFTKQEHELICSDITINKLNLFYKIWTLKESYIKEQGKGFSIPMNSFEIKFMDEKNLSQIEINNTKKFCKTYESISGYIISVCSKDVNFPDYIKIYQMEDIC